MRGRAGSINHGKRGGTISGVGDVVHMVRCVKILAIPAAVRRYQSQSLDLKQVLDEGNAGHLHGEDDTRSDTTRARPRREALGIETLVKARRIGVAAKVGGGVAPVAALDPAAEICRRAAGNATRKHAETLREQHVSNKLAFFTWVRKGLSGLTYRLEGSHSVGTRCGVVHGDAAVGVSDNVVDHLRNPLKAAVARTEVDVGGPVVGQVLVEGARGAACQLGDVFHRHRGVESVLWALARSITTG